MKPLSYFLSLALIFLIFSCSKEIHQIENSESRNLANEDLAELIEQIKQLVDCDSNNIDYSVIAKQYLWGKESLEALSFPIRSKENLITGFLEVKLDSIGNVKSTRIIHDRYNELKATLLLSPDCDTANVKRELYLLDSINNSNIKRDSTSRITTRSAENCVGQYHVKYQFYSFSNSGSDFGEKSRFEGYAANYVQQHYQDFEGLNFGVSFLGPKITIVGDRNQLAGYVRMSLKTILNQAAESFTSEYIYGLLINDVTVDYISCSGVLLPNPDGGNNGGGDSGDNSSTSTLDALISDQSKLTDEQKRKIQDVLNDVTSDCVGQQIFNQLRSENGKYTFVVDPSFPYKAAFDPQTNEIKIKDVNVLKDYNLREELFHAFQNQYLNGIKKYYGVAGHANIEFEAKLLRDINQWVTGIGGTYLLDDDDYMNWLDEITNHRTIFPTGNIFDSTYLKFLNRWVPRSEYGELRIKEDMPPESMIRLFRNSNCKK